MPAPREQPLTIRGQKLALLGLVINFALAATKLLAGIIGNS
jgi:divalent metal cation (Fe/Co/Zn/Cd) transporter